MSLIPKIQVYVSYNTVQKEQLTALENAFNCYNDRKDKLYQIELKYDENTIQVGESFVKFMEEIALARFVVLLFSKEYFESPYCLYELLSAHKKQKDNEARFFVLPIKLENCGAAINTYTIENLLDAWQGKGELSQSAQDKGTDFCQNRLRELLGCEDDDEVGKLIRFTYDDVIKPWLHSNIPEQTCADSVKAIEAQATDAFQKEEKNFNQFIKEKITKELGTIKDLDDSWENYSGDELRLDRIANELMNEDCFDSLRKVQGWAKAEKKYAASGKEWKKFFNSIQKIAGWFVLQSINQDWWLNNKLSFIDGTINSGFVELPLKKESWSYSEVVVSRALKKHAQLILDKDHKVIPLVRQNTNFSDDGFVFEGTSNGSLDTLLIPIITDLKKIKPKGSTTKKLFNELISTISADTDTFFYLVTKGYLEQLKQQDDPNGSGKKVLELINEKIKGKLFFIAINIEENKNEQEIAEDPVLAIQLMERILIIDK